MLAYAECLPVFHSDGPLDLRRSSDLHLIISVHPYDVEEGHCTYVDHMRRWSKARWSGQRFDWHVIPDGLTIFALNSHQRSPGRSSSVLRSSDVAFPPGHKSWTPKTSRRYSSKQLLLDSVFPSLPHRRPGTVERLSSGPSPLSELQSFERPASSIWRRKSCVAVGRVGHPPTDEVRLKKFEKMRSIQSCRCWASVRLLS